MRKSRISLLSTLLACSAFAETTSWDGGALAASLSGSALDEWVLATSEVSATLQVHVTPQAYARFTCSRNDARLYRQNGVAQIWLPADFYAVVSINIDGTHHREVGFSWATIATRDIGEIQEWGGSVALDEGANARAHLPANLHGRNLYLWVPTANFRDLWQRFADHCRFEQQELVR